MPVRLSRTALSPSGPPRTRKNPAGPGVHVQAGHAQGVVVVPQRGLALVVRVVEDRKARTPRHSRTSRWPCRRRSHTRCPGSQSCPGCHSPLADTTPRRSRHSHHQPPQHHAGAAPSALGPGIGKGSNRTSAACRVPPRRRGVRPVQRRVDRQQVRSEVAIGVDEVVDPLDPHRPLPRRLDRERRRMMKEQPLLARSSNRPVPHTGVVGIPAGRICCSN